MFLFNILVYVGFALIMCHLAYRSCCAFPKSENWDKYLKWYVAFFTVICAIRWNVGADAISYALIFENGDYREQDDINGEILFYGLTKLSSLLGLPFVIGMGLCAFLQIYPITKALKEYKYLLIVLPLVLFGSRFFLDLNNGVRQMVVASMFIYASRFIVDKKPWHYTVFILLGATIHQSAYILIPFYFIPNRFIMADKRKLMLLIFTFCFIVGQTPAFQNFMGYAESLTKLFGYEGYTERVGLYLSQGETEEALAFGPMMLSYLLTAYFTIWFGPYLKEHYEDKIPYFNLWYNLSFFYACAYFLVCNISHIFIRPVQHFELFQMIIVSLLLYEFRYSEFRNQVLYVSLLVTIWVNTSWDVTKSSGLRKECSTYKVFFMHLDQVNRVLHKG